MGVLVKDQLESGPLAVKLAQDLAKLLHHEAGLSLADPVVAASVIFQVAGLTAGDTVALTPLAPDYILTAARWAGLRLLFVDTEEELPVISVKALSALEDEQPKLIIADACLGFLPDFAGLKSLGFPILEDFTQSLGSWRDLVIGGASGDFSLYSFGQGALLTGLGGAFVSAKSKAGALELKAMEQSLPAGSKMTEPSAALAASQFHHREKAIERKKELHRQFFHKIHKPYRLPVQDGDAELVPPYLVLLAETGARDAVQYAQRQGVQADFAFGRLDRALWESDPEFCPNARQFLTRCLLFPLHSSLTGKEAELVGKVISTLP